MWKLHQHHLVLGHLGFFNAPALDCECAALSGGESSMEVVNASSLAVRPAGFRELVETSGDFLVPGLRIVDQIVAALQGEEENLPIRASQTRGRIHWYGIQKLLHLLPLELHSKMNNNARRNKR